jgi:hypothetical protein
MLGFEGELTLNTNVYVILRLLGLSCVFVGFGEGVFMVRNVSTRIFRSPDGDPFGDKGSSQQPPKKHVWLQKRESVASDCYIKLRGARRGELTEGLEIFD